jgi:hypothetical protein
MEAEQESDITMNAIVLILSLVASSPPTGGPPPAWTPEDIAEGLRLDRFEAEILERAIRAAREEARLAARREFPETTTRRDATNYENTKYQIQPLQSWYLRDIQGMWWTHNDKGYLERWVAARNTSLAPPPVVTQVTVPTYQVYVLMYQVQQIQVPAYTVTAYNYRAAGAPCVGGACGLFGRR